MIPLDLQPTLAGELLSLRPLRPDDFDALYAVASDRLIWEQHPNHDRWQEPVFRQFFQEALASGGALLATENATGQVIGSSRYFGYDATQGVVEIGWSFLARRCWGGVYNGEMKRLMLEHAFGAVPRVIFVVGENNRRSQRAVEKIGGVRTDALAEVRGQPRVVYELTPERYARRERR